MAELKALTYFYLKEQEPKVAKSFKKRAGLKDVEVAVKPDLTLEAVYDGYQQYQKHLEEEAKSKKRARDSSSSSSSSSSSDSSSSSSSDSSSSSSSSEEEERAPKKAAVSPPSPKSAERKKKTPTSAKMFKRIDESKVQFLSEDQRVLDNSYQSAFGRSGWGGDAAAHLIKVKGKDFRHEKTKKKRGSYRGGAIDINQVSSVRFDSSE